jgi:hypothetical protein
VRNQIIRDALDNARDHLDRAEDTNLSRAVECLYTALREMNPDPSDDSCPDSYDYGADYVEPEPQDDWHVHLYVEHQIFLSSAERRAENARLRAIAETALRKAGKIK